MMLTLIMVECNAWLEQPVNGGAGDCTLLLKPGASCQPTCNPGYTASGPSKCSALGVLTAASCIAGVLTELHKLPVPKMCAIFESTMEIMLMMMLMINGRLRRIGCSRQWRGRRLPLTAKARGVMPTNMQSWISCIWAVNVFNYRHTAHVFCFPNQLSPDLPFNMYSKELSRDDISDTHMFYALRVAETCFHH